MMMNSARPLSLPRWSDPCLCGSGKSFLNCCRNNLPGAKMNETWQEPARQQQWHRVLKAIRADLTQYSIYHRTNTVPLMRVLPPEQIEILSIDIEALDETVDQLAAAYWQLGILSDFPATLERLRGNIDDPRWQRKITYHQAMTAHLLDDTEGARRELSKLGAIGADESDIDLLQLHLDINWDRVALVDKLKLYDRILELTNSRADRMHYAAAKGVELMVAGDTAGAISVVYSAINAARQSESEAAFGPDAELWFSKLLEVAGVAKVDRPLFVEAAARLEHLLTLVDHWTSLGRAHLFRCLGDVRRMNAEWADAEEAYANAFVLDHDPINRVFQATCLLLQGKKTEAHSLIKEVEFENLDNAERVDYAIAYAAIAIGLRNLDELTVAEKMLNVVRPIRQYFENQRLTYRLAIERARAAIVAGEPVPKSSRLLEWVNSLSRWIMVQPNVAGFGLNVNAMVDDAVAARRRKQAGKDDK